jgi:MFS family permease
MTYFRLGLRRSWPDLVLTIGAIVASVAFVMELTLLPLLLSAIQRDLGLSVGGLAWVINAYAIAVAVAVLTSGFFGDVFDRRKLFMCGVGLFAIGSVLSAQSDTLQTLLISRTLQGLGGGLFSPLVPILLTQANSEHPGKALMVWGGLIGVAAAVLPFFGSVVLTGLGWQAVFGVLAVIALLGLLFVLLGGGEIGEGREQTALNHAQLLSLPSYWVLLLYIFLTYGCFSFYLFFFPVNWSQDGFDSQSVSIFLTCLWLSFSVLSFALRNRITGLGLGRSLRLAPVLLAASFAVAVLGPDSHLFQIISAVFVGAGLACCNAPSTHLLLRVSPHDLRAFSSSLDITFARFGSVLVVALFSSASPLFAAVTVGALAAIAVLSCRFFPEYEVSQA